MSSPENLRLMHRWFQEVWNEGKTDTVYELLSPDAVGKGQSADAEIHGPKDFLPFVERIRGAFPDIHITIEDSFAAEDKVVVRWSANMTHSGDHLGLAATGKPVRLTGMSIVRFLDGQIIEGWDNWDQLGMLRQIGAYQPENASLAA